MSELGQTQAPATAAAPRLPRTEIAPLLLGAALLAALIAAGEYLTLSAAVAIPLDLLRLLLGLVYVLYVPGYCLTAALFPRADDLDGIERTGLSLGLSVAWVPVLALILDRLPWGLRLWPIFLGQLLSILLFMAIAVWRRERLPAGEAYLPDTTWRPRPWWRGLPRLEKRIYALCLGALLVAGLAAAWVFLVPSPDEFMTEFYILGQEGLAEDYPREAGVGETLAVTMGITNREREAMDYTVEVWAVDPWNDQRELVNTAGPFQLAPDERHEQPLTWQMPWAGDDLMVDFYLYSAGEAPYRALRLWLDVDPQ
jgi:uncharacterized membrane protein